MRGGYASEFLFPCEIIFDELSRLLGVDVIVWLLRTVRFGLNHCGWASFIQLCERLRV